MRLLENSTTRNIFDSLRELDEAVTIDTGSTSITSDESGVTVEDNGNIIATNNGVTINVNNSTDTLPAEMDLMNQPEEAPLDNAMEEVPTENIENVEPVEELPEEPVEETDEDLEESTVNEEVLEKKDEETEEELNNSKVEECDKSDKKDEKIEEAEDIKSIEKQLAIQKNLIKDYQHEMNGADYQEHIKKIKELEDKLSKLKLKEADGYNQNQNVEIYQNPEFDYQILDITELDNTDTGDVRAIDMANIIADLDESLTESCGDPNYFNFNSFLTRKGEHYSSALLEFTLPRLNESIDSYKNVFFLEVAGNNKLKECTLRDSKNHIIKEYSGKSANPVEFFKNVFIDIDRKRKLTEEVSDAAYEVAELVEKQFEGVDLIIWEDFRDAVYAYAQELNLGLSDDEIWDFEQDVRGVLGQYGWSTIYEGTYEGGLTTGDPNMYESVKPMVNEPMKNKGVNFADGKAIDKDEKRQENHLKQHANRNKENKKFKIEKEPDQDNTTGKKEEELTDTEKVDKLPKAKKTKVDAKKLKVKEIKEDVSIRGTEDNGNNYSFDKKITKPYYTLIIEHNSGDIVDVIEFDTLDEAKSWVNNNKNVEVYDYEICDGKTNDCIEYINESVKLNEMGNFAGRMDTLRAAGDRETLYRNDVINQKNKKVRELFNRLKEIQDDVAELKEIGKHVRLYDLKSRFNIWLDASDRGLDYGDIDETLYVDTDKILMKEPALAVCEVTPEELTGPNPWNHKDVFIKLATRMLDNYPGYIEAVNKMIDDYDLKYPVKSQEGMSESAKSEKNNKLTEAEDELLDEPEVTDGSDMRDGREDLEESGTDVAIFHRKPQSVSAMRAAEQNGITVNKSNYKIVGKKEMNNEEFENFANHLNSEEYDWLKEYNDTTNSGEFKCVEVVNTDDDSYTILVDPQGYNYARYAAIKDNFSNEEELLEPEEELIDEEPAETTE